MTYVLSLASCNAYIVISSPILVYCKGFDSPFFQPLIPYSAQVPNSSFRQRDDRVFCIRHGGQGASGG